MRTTLGKQMFVMFFVPLILIFGILSYIIYSMVSSYVNDSVELEIRGLTEINATDLAGQIESVRIAVLSMSSIIESVNHEDECARYQVSRLLRSLFTNDVIYNAWLIYEPDAFDGRDRYHTGDYPGAPSGRFMLSYVVDDDGEIIIVPDMVEDELDDMSISYWYIVPRDTGRLYIDVDNVSDNIWDYGLEDENPLYTLTVAAPIFRDGEVIGVVGADVIVDTMTISIDPNHRAAHVSNVAVFYSSGGIFYSPNIEYAEESIHTLGFENITVICEAFENREPVFLPNEWCMFAETRALVFFQPVYIKNYDDVLYLYVSLSRSVLFNSMFPIFLIITVTSIAVLTALLFLLIFVIRTVSRPLNRLTTAAKAIAQGNIEVAIGYSPDARSEIGLLSQSLHTMVEQFRVNTMNMEQAQQEASIKAQIEAFITTTGNMRQVFDGLSNMLCVYFELFNVTIVYVNEGTPTAFSDKAQPYIFLAHDQTVALLNNKKVVALNSQAIKGQNINYASPQTNAMCLSPLRPAKSGELLGYIIYENIRKTTISEGSELVMMYISEIISEWLRGKKWDGPRLFGVEHEKSDDTGIEENGGIPQVIKDLRAIEGIDVDLALEMMGGLHDAYEKTVRLLARLLPECIARMTKFLSEGKIKDFAIEVHGIKSVLKNIGAKTLGSDAAGLENAAIEDNVGFCWENYPTFRSTLEDFSNQLNSILKPDESEAKEQLSKERLIEVLAEAKTAAEVYDAMGATEIITGLNGFTYSGEVDKLLESIVFALEEFNCGDAINYILSIEKEILQ